MTTRYQGLIAARDDAKRAVIAARDEAIKELQLEIAQEREEAERLQRDADEAFLGGIEFYRKNLAEAAQNVLGHEIEIYAQAFYRDNGRKLMKLIRETEQSCRDEANSPFDARWICAAFATRVSKKLGPISEPALAAAGRVINASLLDDISALEIAWRAFESACHKHAVGDADDEARMSLLLSSCDYSGATERLNKFEAQLKARRDASAIAELERLQFARTNNLPEPASGLSTLEMLRKLQPELAAAMGL